MTAVSRSVNWRSQRRGIIENRYLKIDVPRIDTPFLYLFFCLRAQEMDPFPSLVNGGGTPRYNKNSAKVKDV